MNSTSIAIPSKRPTRRRVLAALCIAAAVAGALAAIAWSACMVRAVTDPEHPPSVRNVLAIGAFAALGFGASFGSLRGARALARDGGEPGLLACAAMALLVLGLLFLALYGSVMTALLNVG